MLRNLNRVVSLARRSTVSAVRPAASQSFRSAEPNPLKHSYADCGQFYTLDPELCKILYSQGGLPKGFADLTKTFTETCIMVREQTIDLIDLMNRCDMSKPVNRFVIYGEAGVGKSLALAHVLHHAYLSNFLIVHVPWAPEWYRRTLLIKEVINSPTREGKVDLPVDCLTWLLHFKQQNIRLMKEQNLTISKDYVWSKREESKAGSSLLDLVELGINRVKHASEVLIAVTEEIKILTMKKQCKTLVAIDGFNSFFYEPTRLKTDSKKKISPKEVTLTNAFLELVKNDWWNGIVILIVDKIANGGDRRESNFPRYLLGKEAFELIDPFIPIEVKGYTDKEFLSCTAYYRDRLWLRGNDDVETELAFLSARNPYKLRELCAPL